MSNGYAILVSGSTSTGAQGTVTLPSEAAGNKLVQGRLSSGGGAATVNVYGRLGPSSAWRPLAALSLSGASDEETALIQGEPWRQMYVDITANTGTVSVEVGY